MKGHDAPLFCICHVRLAPHQHIKTAWEYCFRSFLVRRLAMPVFQCIADKSSRLFHNVKSNAEFGGLIGKKGDMCGKESMCVKNNSLTEPIEGLI